MENINNQIYLINKNIILSCGHKNCIIYNLDNNKITHCANKLANYLIEKECEKIPASIIEVIGQDYTISELEINTDRFESVKNVYLDLTDCCNFKCKNCFHKEVGEGQLVADEVIEKINQLENKSEIVITLMGGEPLLYKHDKLVTLLRKWSKEFKSINLFTNASLLDDELIEVLKECGVLTRITFYSADEDVHNKYTGIKNSFNHNFKMINKLRDNENKFKINLIFNKKDYNDYKNGKTIFNEITDSKYVDLVRPNNYSELQLIKDREEVLDERYKPLNIRTIDTVNLFMKNHSCYASKMSIAINGDVYACPWDRNKKIGNIVKDDYEELKEKLVTNWERPIHEEYIMCKECEFKILCFDCTYINKTIFKNSNIDYNSKPYFCTYNPISGGYEDGI